MTSLPFLSLYLHQYESNNEMCIHVYIHTHNETQQLEKMFSHLDK